MRNKPITAAWLTPAAAFILSAGLWVTALALFGFYPFGEHSILITDMGQQYVEFHIALYDMIKKSSSLFFTWNTGMGMNFIGLFAYYLASPFTTLLLLFPRTAIPEALLFIISLKIAASGLTFSVFLRRAADVRSVVNVIFSVLYALSSYTVVFFFNIMWLDAVVLLPLVILAVRHVIHKQKTAPLIAVLFVLFLANFYTAFMVGFYSFLLLIALLWLGSYSRRKNIHIIALFLRAAMVAACLSAFLMVPTYFALKECQSMAADSPIFIGLNIDPLTLLSKFAWGSYDSITDSGSANIYCGVLSFLLLPIWLLHTRISRREKIAMSALLSFLLLSMLYCPLDVLWHACETPVWFPSRYSFVFIFTVLTCTAKALSLPEGINTRRILYGFSAAAILIFFSIKAPEWIYPKEFHIKTGNVFITMAALVVYTLLLLIIIRKKRWMRSIGLILLILCISAELVGNTYTSFQKLDKELHFETHDNFSAYITRSKNLTATLNTYAASVGDTLSPTNFYRVENSNARNANDGLMGGYPSISHYSSFSQRGTFTFLKNCGMVCTSGNKFFRYYGSTAALDSVLGLRYVYGTNEIRAGYRSTGIQTDGLKLYENKYALPLTFFADQKIQELPSSGKTPFSLLNTFLSSLDGRDYSYYSPLTFTTSCENGILNQTENHTSISTENTAVLHFKIRNPKWQDVLLCFSNNLPDTTAVYVNGQLMNPNGERMVRGIMDFGKQPQGDVEVTLYTSNKRWFTGLQAMTFDETAFSNLVTSLRKTSPKDLTVTNTNIGEPLVTGQITAPRDGTLFTSIPADSSWTAEVDGKKVNTVSAGSAFLTIPITEGDHSFVLQFRPRGLAEGCILSGITALLCIGWFVFRLIRKRTA